MIKFLAVQVRLGKITLDEIENKFGVETRSEVEDLID